MLLYLIILIMFDEEYKLIRAKKEGLVNCGAPKIVAPQEAAWFVYAAAPALGANLV
jgi:hypothetical protein